jgi:hypothetical protein
MADITDIEKAPEKSNWHLLEAKLLLISRFIGHTEKGSAYLQPKSIQLQNMRSRPSSSSSSKANVDRHAFRGTGG